MEETLFKLARAITDTGTDTVSSKGGTITYRITSLKRKLVNGKVVSTSTPSCTLGSASVSWATWGGVTVGDGYLDVKINYSENTGSSRSTTLTFDQDGSGNKINLTVTQEAGVTYSGYIEMVSNTLPLGSDKYNTAQIIVMAYLKGSDGSKKPETPQVGNAPYWCSVSIAQVDTLENHYRLSLTALSSNQTGAIRSGHIFLTCGDTNLSIPVTQKSQKASTFTLSGLPTTGTGYYLFGKGARPQNTPSSDKAYIQGLSATDTITMEIPFYANDSEPGSLIKCTTGDTVSVYTKSGATWILEGSFTVPSAGGTVSIQGKVLKLGGRDLPQDVYAEIIRGNSEKWTIQSQKRKYVNGKLSGVIEVGYSASINTPDYILEEDKSNNIIQITAQNDGTSGLCILTQNESGNKINLHLTTPEEKEYWEIHFNPITINGVDTSAFFAVATNISGESGSMADGGILYKNWMVNQNRYMINVYISNMYPGNFDMLSWSCLDKNGNAFSPNYNIPDNQYFTIKTTGLGSYTLKKISTPFVSSGTLILSSRFNPTKKYPLDLNFYWGAPT